VPLDALEVFTIFVLMLDISFHLMRMVKVVSSE
jgi:hypothetical protein